MDGKERHYSQLGLLGCLLYRKIIPPMLSPVYEISYSVHIVKELSEESFNYSCLKMKDPLEYLGSYLAFLSSNLAVPWQVLSSMRLVVPW